MLARAIAHDLTLDDHRDLWLRNADITRLSEMQGGPKGFLKRLMMPLVDRVVATGMKTQFSDRETRQKLCSLMRARWFKPPFSGERFSGWMLDAYDAMDRPEKAGETLLPPGHRPRSFRDPDRLSRSGAPHRARRSCVHRGDGASQDPAFRLHPYAGRRVELGFRAGWRAGSGLRGPARLRRSPARFRRPASKSWTGFSRRGAGLGRRGRPSFPTGSASPWTTWARASSSTAASS